MKNHYIVDKTTGTFADELLAAGFMVMLDNLYSQQNITPNLTQIDYGHYYLISAETPLNLETVQHETQFFVGAKFIRTKANKKKLPTDLPETYFVDYEQKRNDRTTFFDALNNLDKTLKIAYWRGDEDVLNQLPPPPDPYYDIYRVMNSPTALIGYTRLVGQWVQVGKHGRTGDVCHLLCHAFRAGPKGQYRPNDIETAVSNWKVIAKAESWPTKDTKATASQLLNPAQGKGINRPQPNGTMPTNQANFWLLEWLKLIGFYQIGLTAVLRDSSDRKTYVPATGHMTLPVRENINRRFRTLTRTSESATRADILTVLQYLKAFILVTREAQAQPAISQLRFSRHRPVKPADFIHGFHVAFYKNLGNASAIMNMAFLNLPGWVQIHDAAEAQHYLHILDEHIQIVQQFVENKGEEIDLLHRFRDFIVADNLDPFFEFTNAYSRYIISQREKRGGYAQQFSAENLRRLLMNCDEEKYAQIFDKNGFRNVARAIRESTVKAQWEKAKARSGKPADTRYMIRYGLGQDLIRRSQYRKEFLSALHEFMQAYNAENFQIKEREASRGKDIYKTYFRPDLYETDFQEIVQLIDDCGSDLICKMLVAFGYARELPQKKEGKNE